MDKPSILAVLGGRVHLRRAGRQWRGLCPFHVEKTPSFYVDEAKGFYCFGCHAKGDVIAFIQKIDDVGFREAIARLGIDGGEYTPKPIDTRKRRAAAMLADWLNDQCGKIGAMCREIQREIAIAERIPDTELVESLTRESEILETLQEDLQRPDHAAGFLALRESIETLTALAPVEPIEKFPPLTPEYRAYLQEIVAC